MLVGRDHPIDQGITNGESILLRDIKDRHYPNKTQYTDFDKRRRWEEHRAIQLNATGVVFRIREWYAYLNADTKEWDFTRAVDLMPRRYDLDELNKRRNEDFGKKVEHYWRHLPRNRQAKLFMYGFVPFEDMLIIDERGDPEYAIPHVFIDFRDQDGPFARLLPNLNQGRQQPIHSYELDKEYKKINAFPEAFPEPKKGTTHELDKLGLTGTPLQKLQRLHGEGLLYSFDGKLHFLSEGDLIHIPKTEKDGMDKYAEVTHVFETTTSTYIKEDESDYYTREMEEYAGRKVKKTDWVTIYEIIEVYTWNKYLTYADRSY